MEAAPGARDGQSVLRCKGPLTLETLFGLQAALRSETSGTVIVELSEVPYIDSAGLGSLVAAHVSYHKAGRRLALAGVNERARTLLKMTNVEQLFRIFPSLGEAEQTLA